MNLASFEYMSFDVYGTLIDWETGIVQALRPVLVKHGFEWSDDQILDGFARYETIAQQPPYSKYPEVLSEVLQRIGSEHGFAPDGEDLAAFAGSVPDWPAFPDSAESLATLKEHVRLAVVTNCDDDLFAASNAKLGVEFDVVVTAEQAGMYKPALKPFHLLFERIGGSTDRLLHVAQSMYHDHEPAKKLGLTTVWINRRKGKDGLGATPPANAQPDLELPDLRSLADMYR
jgi:2-haloacid dehalogenase